MVRGTIEVPVGSIITGSSWSTIMAEGSYFEDESDPQVMVRVGERGDSGVIEISDMLFTVKGPTAGCILMEWNVHQSSQGSAAMWDSHFRVGGNAGSDLLLDDCPVQSGSIVEECMAASMLLHLTEESSGFFDNVWVWVADHDLDDPANADTSVGEGGIPMNGAVEISVYAGRGVLIESQGPSWFWGCGSEHAQLYQWQLLGAREIFMGHVQTETPYYQSSPSSLEPFEIGLWPSDPTFEDCSTDLCRKAWAMRILNSTDVYLYALGFYSFFEEYELGCAPEEDCQKSLIETNYAGKTWLYNIFTKGNHEIVSPRGSLPPLWFNGTTRNGYTSSIAAWLSLARDDGAEIGAGDNPSEEGSGVVYIDPEIWDTDDDETGTVQCYPPCTYVLPPFTLSEPTTISFTPYTTSVEVGWFTSTEFEEGYSTVTTTVYESITHTTVISPPPVTLTTIPVRNVNISDNVTETTFRVTYSVDVPPVVITNEPKSGDPTSITVPPNTRTIYPPPWPWPENEEDDDDDDTGIVLIHNTGPDDPTCRSGCGPLCRIFCDTPCLLSCPWPDGPPGRYSHALA
jgi:hypothetical protein